MFKLARGRPIAAAFRAATVSSSRCRTLGPYPIFVDGLLMRRMLSRSPPSSLVSPSNRSVTCLSTSTCPPVSSSRYVNRVPIPASVRGFYFFDRAGSLIMDTVWHRCSQGRGRSLCRGGRGRRQVDRYILPLPANPLPGRFLLNMTR